MATGEECLSLEADITCSLCFEFLGEPWSLACCHNYCRTCIHKINRVKEENQIGVLCPMCREFCCEENIRANFALKNLIQAYAKRTNITDECAIEQKNVCIQCDSNNITSYCVDCQIYLCNKCKNTHLRLPHCKLHSILPADKRGMENEVVMNTFCNVHPHQELKLCCKPCNKALCYECKVEHHDTHETEPVKAALERMMPEVKQNIQKIKQQRAETQYILELIKQSYYEQEQHKEIIKQQILQEKQRKINKINLDAQNLLEELDLLGSLEDLEINIKDLKYKLSSQKSIVNWAETIVTAAEGPGLLCELLDGLSQSLKNHADEKETDFEKIQQRSISNFNFIANDIGDEVNMIGHIMKKEIESSLIDKENTADIILSGVMASSLTIDEPDYTTEIPTATALYRKPNRTRHARRPAPSPRRKSVHTFKPLPDLPSENEQPGQDTRVLTPWRNSHISAAFRQTYIELKNLNGRCLQKIMEFKLRRDVNRLCFHENNLLGVSYSKNFYAEPYDTSGKLLHSNLNNISRTHHVLEINPLNPEQMIAATLEGLILIDITGNMVSKLRDGVFTAVHLRGSVIAALCHQDTWVKTLMLIDIHTAESINQFTVDEYAEFVLLHESHVVIQSNSKSCTVITKYTLQGEVIGSFGRNRRVNNPKPGYFDVPMLCMTDIEGSVLVADCNNNRLQVLNKDGEWSVIKSDINIPKDAVITPDGFMYVLSGRDNIVTKYKCNVNI